MGFPAKKGRRDYEAGGRERRTKDGFMLKRSLAPLLTFLDATPEVAPLLFFASVFFLVTYTDAPAKPTGAGGRRKWKTEEESCDL